MKFCFLIIMSLWMWPPPAVHISSVYCVGVNFNFSLFIFRQEREVKCGLYRRLHLQLLLMRDWFGYKQGIITCFPSDNEESPQKQCFWQAGSESIQNFLLGLYKIFNSSFMSNNMGKIASSKTYCIEIADTTMVILNIKYQTSWMNWIYPNPRGSKSFFHLWL